MSLNPYNFTEFLTDDTSNSLFMKTGGIFTGKPQYWLKLNNLVCERRNIGFRRTLWQI